MTSQDGTPVPGPYIFPVIVCWRPSTCSESRVGVLRHGIMTEGMRDGEDVRRSVCVTERKTLAFVSQSYRCCGARLTTVAAASLCSGVKGDGLRKGGNGRQREALKPTLQRQDCMDMLHRRTVLGGV